MAVAVVSAVLLVAVTVVALRHGSQPKRLVVLPAATTAVTCGQIITVSITVGNDLNCPSGNGLNVGHASITINLNGHTLAGNPGGSGVVNGSASVTIENGTLSGWEAGVRSDGSATKVTGIRATGNGIGIETIGPSATLTGNVAFLNSSNGIDAGGGNTLVSNNTVRQNGGNGINVEGNGYTVATNQAEDNGAAGIHDRGSANIFSGNVANANGTSGTNDGINSVNDPRAVLKANTTNYNTSYGIEAYAGTTDGGGNAAKGNTEASQCKNVVCS